MTKIPKLLTTDYSEIDKGLIGVNKLTYKEVGGLSPSAVKKEKSIFKFLNRP